MISHWNLQVPRQEEISAMRRIVERQRARMDELEKLLAIPASDRRKTKKGE
jgi:hypothetical protein